jgi:tetratricopeptide (TPR) repeat protein
VRRILLAALALAALLPCAASAQGRDREPRRPRLDAAADTNSAQAYYSHGVRVLQSSPAEAGDAFYWATRIEPGMADAWYARRVAFMMSRPERFGAYMQGNRRVIESREMRAVDSLHLRALTLNPFVRTKFDRIAFDHWVQSNVRRGNTGAPADPALVRFEVDRYLRSGGPASRAWMAYADGRFPTALAEYARALREARKGHAGIHADRARIFLLVGRPDSALVEMRNAVERLRARDERDLVYLYESKAIFEHSTGNILEQRGEVDAAREAYGRALQEDLSYYPAHTALAGLAQAAGDTATALAEMDLAVQIRGDDALLRYDYGKVLAFAGKHMEAVEQLRRATELEPWFAAPYALLGGMLEATGKPTEGVEAYRAFFARAGRTHPLRDGVRARMAALGEAAP